MSRPNENIIRTDKDENYTRIDNDLLNDMRLSYGARGVMGYLLSKPNHWDTRIEDLMANGNIGRITVRSLMRELEQFGYLVRERRTDSETGQFIWRTIVHEKPEIDAVIRIAHARLREVSEAYEP